MKILQRKVLMPMLISLAVTSSVYAITDPFALVPRESEEYTIAQSVMKQGIAQNAASRILLERDYPLTRYEMGLVTAGMATATVSKIDTDTEKQNVAKLVTQYTPEVTAITGDPKLALAFESAKNTAVAKAEAEANAARQRSNRSSPSPSRPVPAEPIITITEVKKEEVPPVPVATKPVSRPDPFQEITQNELLALQSKKGIPGGGSTGTPGSGVDKSATDATQARLNKALKTAKSFFKFSGEHLIKFAEVKTTGNVPLDDTNNLDDNGNPVVPKYRDQRQLKHSITLSPVWQISEAFRITTNLIAENKDGMIWDKEKEDGDKTFGVGNVILSLWKKTTVTIGTFNAFFSSYTLDQSDIKGVKVEHEEKDFAVTVVDGNLDRHAMLNVAYKDSDNILNVFDPRTYKGALRAAQIISRGGLIAGMDIAFNYARVSETVNKKLLNGDEVIGSGSEESKSTVYGLTFSGDVHKYSIAGEYAKYKPSGTSTQQVGDESTKKDLGIESTAAFYIDIAKQFNERISATLHYVDIGKDFGSSNLVGLVQDKTGDYTFTEDGDGKRDFEYAGGQKGYDLGVTYVLKKNISNLAFGLSNYSRTEDGNRLLNWYVSGNYLIPFVNKKGQSIGQVNISQMYEKRKTETPTEDDPAVFDEKNQTVWTSQVTSSFNLMKGNRLNSNVTVVRDNVDGNETRTSTSMTHNIPVTKRLTVVPSIQYDTKKGTGENAMDTKTLLTAVNANYALKPNELYLNAQLSMGDYKVGISEISDTTGELIDGESRKVNRIGLGVNWQPKKFAGLTVGTSYSRDKTNYRDPLMPDGNANVLNANVGYSFAMSKTTRANLNVNYNRSDDKKNPQYNETVLAASANVNAKIGEKTNLSLDVTREKHEVPITKQAVGEDASYSVTQTILNFRQTF